MVSRKLVVPVALVAVVMAAVGTYLLFHGDGTSTAGTPAAQPPASPGRLTPAEAAQLADDVTSGDEKRVRAAMAVSPNQPLDAAAVSGLASIDELAFEMKSFRDHRDGTADVLADVVAPGTTTQWLVHLVAADESWLISSTEPAP